MPQTVSYLSADAVDRLRPPPQISSLSRSPHPYHRRKWKASGVNNDDLAEDDCDHSTPHSDLHETPLTPQANGETRYSKSPSDSGTEADDESATLLKGLPAPPTKPRKGLRDSRGADAEAISSPLPTPTLLHANSKSFSTDFDAALQEGGGAPRAAADEARRLSKDHQRRRRAEVIRRSLEICFVFLLGGIVALHGKGVRIVATGWWQVLMGTLYVVLGLIFLYPLRVLLHTRGDLPFLWSNASYRVRLSSAFDPAPLLYPVMLPTWIALSLSPMTDEYILPNLVLGLSAIPAQLIPGRMQGQDLSTLHWLLTSIPLVTFQLENSYHSPFQRWGRLWNHDLSIDARIDPLLYLYPLHQTLVLVLRHLTTTSLLAAESQLLSISLINILLFSVSPQSIILKVLIWGGGLGICVFCGRVLRWSVTLARIPRWRFRRVGQAVRANNAFLSSIGESFGHRSSVIKLLTPDRPGHVSDADEDGLFALSGTNLRERSIREEGCINGDIRSEPIKGQQHDSAKLGQCQDKSSLGRNANGLTSTSSRHKKETVPSPEADIKLGRAKTQSQEDLRSRRRSSVAHSYMELTPWQATIRKRIYAVYIYITILFIILLGIRRYVGKHALHGHEPVGWAIGYLLGDIPQVRQFVTQQRLAWWVSLPGDQNYEFEELCHLGWVERLRFASIGAANTRLLVCIYCVGVFMVGMAVVLRLSTVVEVDTRRKVFHGMMVAMFLPATYVDPAFASLALILILAIFLLLDLIRASQLPPLSRPLAAFLTPYVDGRDLRGPVVVSHVFLLIGCAIPLWLSLAEYPRSGADPWVGWDVPYRDVGMVSGVICVGMGDAAASLIGRRFGRRKWLWSGGKSIEGSCAFTVAVWLGLVFAQAWLRIGGWQGGSGDTWVWTATKAAVAGSGASFLEAVLTGGNDNVVVPVALWLLVKGLKI
ncbi:MAG: hypothetical protein M1833_006553 [Piccolia ochrophora]|nr:MAG: hypothetical protein M1833_006553 [Piccolia ochrophora]